MRGGFFGGWGPKQTREPWTGLAVPVEVKTFDDVRALVPDELPPASPLAQRTARIFISTGVPAGMIVRPQLLPDAKTIQFCFMLAFASDLPGFVTIPTVAYLLDQWCVEEKFDG